MSLRRGILGTFHLVILVLLLIVAPQSFEARKKSKSAEEVNEEEKTWITGNTTHFHTASGPSVVKIGSFNLKQFGMKKSKNEAVLKIVAKIVSRYDLIALQEITDVKETSIQKLMGAVGKESAFQYDYIVSSRVGRTKQKEQYGLIFKRDVFQIKRHIVFDDSTIGDPFSREPQIAEVIVKGVGVKFAIVNVHVAPKNASTEISSLTDVLSWVEKKWRIRNMILLGDLNAACDYIRKKDIPNIRLLNNPKYHWLIPNTVDTTVGNTNCAYDRIIISGPYLLQNVVQNSAKAFEFDQEFDLEQKTALNVSDHYPVEFSIYINNAEINDDPDRIQASSLAITKTPVNTFKVFGIVIIFSSF